MPLKFDTVSLQSGDVLLYGGTGLISWLIRTKTWSKYGHCEMYDTDGYAFASRNGLGVARYPVRTDGLMAVLRLRRSVPFSMDAVRQWFPNVDGQPYDWIGLLAFVDHRRQGGPDNFKMVCSELVLRLLRVGIGAAIPLPATTRVGDRRSLAAMGLDPCNGYDASGVAPSELVKSALLNIEAEAS